LNRCTSRLRTVVLYNIVVEDYTLTVLSNDSRITEISRTLGGSLRGRNSTWIYIVASLLINLGELEWPAEYLV